MLYKHLSICLCLLAWVCDGLVHVVRAFVQDYKRASSCFPKCLYCYKQFRLLQILTVTCIIKPISLSNSCLHIEAIMWWKKSPKITSGIHLYKVHKKGKMKQHIVSEHIHKPFSIQWMISLKPIMDTLGRPVLPTL